MNLLLGHHAPAVFGHAFNGAFNRARHATVQSCEPLIPLARAGRDLAVWAIGDSSGGYEAHRDIVTVWARGDLTGAITAGRDVGIATGSDPCRDPHNREPFPFFGGGYC